MKQKDVECEKDLAIEFTATWRFKLRERFAYVNAMQISHETNKGLSYFILSNLNLWPQFTNLCTQFINQAH